MSDDQHDEQPPDHGAEEELSDQELQGIDGGYMGPPRKDLPSPFDPPV